MCKQGYLPVALHWTTSFTWLMNRREIIVKDLTQETRVQHIGISGAWTLDPIIASPVPYPLRHTCPHTPCEWEHAGAGCKHVHTLFVSHIWAWVGVSNFNWKLKMTQLRRKRNGVYISNQQLYNSVCWLCKTRSYFNKHCDISLGFMNKCAKLRQKLQDSFLIPVWRPLDPILDPI